MSRPTLSTDSPILASPFLSDSLALISNTPTRRRRLMPHNLEDPSLVVQNLSRERTASGTSLHPHHRRVYSAESPIQNDEQQPLIRQKEHRQLTRDDSVGATFVQSVLNSINVLVGVGLLAYPFAFKTAGWAGGAVLVLLGIVTCYTATVLGKCLERDPEKQPLITFTDIGKAAFGSNMELFIGLVIFLELFTSLSGYIILEGDNLEAVLPELGLSKFHWMLIVTGLIIPTTWIRDLSKLSVLSVVGILASVFLFLTVFYLGFVEEQLLHSEAKTVLVDVKGLPVSIGLIMVALFILRFVVDSLVVWILRTCSVSKYL